MYMFAILWHRACISFLCSEELTDSAWHAMNVIGMYQLDRFLRPHVQSK